jgi:hypothetical protein
MPATDLWIIGGLQLGLIVFAGYAAFRDARIRRLERTGGVIAVVTRGKGSMTSLYTVYGAAVASILVLINNAYRIEGHKVLLIVVDVSCVTYLFYFSTWFRNSVFFPLLNRVRQD